jgi:O-antigen ligase
MSRLQSILTGIATAAAVVLVVVSIDFGKLAASFHQVAALPVALAAVLLVANFLLAFFRFEWTLGAVGIALDRRTAVYAFALGNLASQFLLNIIGQSLTRAVVLQANGVPMSATVAATWLERLIAIATVGAGATVSALALFGSLGFELRQGGAYMLSIALAVAAVLVVVGFPRFAAAIGRDELRAMLRTAGRLTPALLASLAVHLAMFAAYAVLVRAFVPDIAWAKLAPAIVIVMFTAGLPISWAGWGLREFGAVYVFSAIGVANELAVVVAVVVGAISLLIALAAGAAVVVDAWRRPKVRPGAVQAKPGIADALAPSDPILTWTIGILAACLIYFQLRVPTGGGELTVNAADPLAITALFFAVVFAATGRFLELFPRLVLWSIAGIAAVLALGLAVAFLGPGLSKWAVVNRMLGFPVLIGYAGIPGLVLMTAGERSRAILIDAFVGAAVMICALQLVALAIHHWIHPLPLDFLRYVFATSGQLEGYAENPNAFAFQLLMALALLLGVRPPVSAHARSSWRLLGAVILLAALVLTRSRAGILCGIGALALAALLHAVPPRALLSRRSIFAALIAGATLVGVAIVLWGSIDRMMVSSFGVDWRPLAGESDALRWQSNVLGWHTWRQHPLLGGGLGAFLLARALIEQRRNLALVIHSVPIWFMAEMGLVGLMAYVLFVASLVAAGVAALRHDAPHARALLVAVAVFAVMSLVHDLFYQRAFWFVAGLLLVAPIASARSPGGARLLC